MARLISRRRLGIALALLSVLGMLASSGLSCPGREGERYAARHLPVSLPAIPLPKGDVAVNLVGGEALTALPGIGETLAGRILREREANGPFHYPEDLTAVAGIGPKTVEGLRHRISMETVP